MGSVIPENDEPEERVAFEALPTIGGAVSKKHICLLMESQPPDRALKLERGEREVIVVSGYF
jgi:hypothetical protein